VEYAFEQDDGQSVRAVAKADVVLVAPSSCRKSPTTMYLALQHVVSWPTIRWSTRISPAPSCPDQSEPRGSDALASSAPGPVESGPAGTPPQFRVCEVEGRYVSHETIYKSLCIQARGVLKRELATHLRTRRLMRKSKLASTAGKPRRQIRDAVSIPDRPAEIEDRAVPGHCDGDLIAGSGNSYIATLVERTSRFAMLVRVPGKDTVSVVSSLSAKIRGTSRTDRRGSPRSSGRAACW